MEWKKLLFLGVVCLYFAGSCSMDELAGSGDTGSGGGSSGGSPAEYNPEDTGELYQGEGSTDYTTTVRDGIEADYIEGEWFAEDDTIYTASAATAGFTFDVPPGSYVLSVAVKCWAPLTTGYTLKSGFDTYILFITTPGGLEEEMRISASASDYKRGYLTINLTAQPTLIMISWQNPETGVTCQIQGVSLEEIEDDDPEETGDDSEETDDDSEEIDEDSEETGDDSEETDNDSEEAGNQSQETGNQSQETGNQSQETNNQSQETNNQSQETNNQSQETGNQSQETNNQSQETGNQSQETDNQSQETGDQSQETNNQSQETDNQSQETGDQSQETDNQSQETDNQSEENRELNYSLVRHGKDVSSLEGRWFETANTIFTYDAGGIASFRFNILKTGRYEVSIKARMYSDSRNSSLPGGYNFYRVGINTGNSELEISINASSRGWETGKGEFEVTQNTLELTLEWLNSREGVNFQLHSVKLRKVD